MKCDGNDYTVYLSACEKCEYNGNCLKQEIAKEAQESKMSTI